MKNRPVSYTHLDVYKRQLGLRAWQKLALQLIVTAVFCWYVMMKSGIGTAIYIPFTNGMELDLGILFVPFLFIAVLGTVNGVNLTDGLDGLAGGVTLIVAAFFMICLLYTSFQTHAGSSCIGGRCYYTKLQFPV